MILIYICSFTYTTVSAHRNFVLLLVPMSLPLITYLNCTNILPQTGCLQIETQNLGKDHTLPFLLTKLMYLLSCTENNLLCKASKEALKKLYFLFVFSLFVKLCFSGYQLCSSKKLSFKSVETKSNEIMYIKVEIVPLRELPHAS